MTFSRLVHAQMLLAGEYYLPQDCKRDGSEEEHLLKFLQFYSVRTDKMQDLWLRCNRGFKGTILA